MKKLLPAAAGAAMLLCAASASATLYTLSDSVSFGQNGITSDTETINGAPSGGFLATTLNESDWGGASVNMLEGTFDHISWTHNYSFIPDYDQLLSAELSLNLEDDEKDCWFKWEIGLTLTENGLVSFDEIDTGTYNYSLSLAGIGDGAFQVTLFDVFGDFSINDATLNVVYDAPTAPVPEPATMLLFGVGLGVTGFTSMRRKHAKKS